MLYLIPIKVLIPIIKIIKSHHQIQHYYTQPQDIHLLILVKNRPIHYYILPDLEAHIHPAGSHFGNLDNRVGILDIRVGNFDNRVGNPVGNPQIDTLVDSLGS